MSCEHLICAQCSGPVSEGRCPVCHAARDQMHHHHHAGASMAIPLMVAALMALLLMLALHLAH
jgi:uncharacterized paraquat-inducible protein A